VPLYLADTSAWARSDAVPGTWESLSWSNQLAICAPVALELLYSARSPRHYRALADELSLFRVLPTTDRAARAAVRTQALLAERSQHRGPRPIDLLIAGVAEVHDATLLHYDRHFDAIARVTGQPMEWLAQPGSLD
jgi:predicted nucleic acid-binding protein